MTHEPVTQEALEAALPDGYTVQDWREDGPAAACVVWSPFGDAHFLSWLLDRSSAADLLAIVTASQARR
jgi:hypothetical protein